MARQGTVKSCVRVQVFSKLSAGPVVYSGRRRHVQIAIDPVHVDRARQSIGNLADRKTMKACNVYPLETVADYVAGHLSDTDAAAVRHHLDGCSECRAAAERLGRLHDALARSETMASRHVPAQDHARIMQEAAAMAASRRRIFSFSRGSVFRIAATAAAAVLIVAVAWYFEHQASTAGERAMAVAVSSVGRIFINGDEVTLEANQPLVTGRTIRTGREARLVMTVPDVARLELNQNTSVRLDGHAGGAALCRLSDGEVYVETIDVADQAPSVLLMRTPSGTVESAPGAAYDLRVVPENTAGFWDRSPGPMLASETVRVLGSTGPRAGVTLAVIRGQVTYRPTDGEPVTVEADSLLVSGPDDATPTVRPVAARRFALWRMSDEELFAMAKPHLAELFGARVVGQLPGQRVELQYDFRSPSELEHDWTYEPSEWLAPSKDRDFVRLRAPDAVNVPLGERPEMVTRATFIGEPDVTLNVTVDPVRQSFAGWAFRTTGSESGEADLVAAGADVRSKGPGGVDLRLTVDGQTRSEAQVSSGPTFDFGGRIEGGAAHVVFGPAKQDATVIVGAVPEAVARRLHDRHHPEALRIVLRAAGPDVVIRHVTIKAQPDPRWLRAELGRLLAE
jgi:anti-sigma factor RsiW